MIEPTGSSNPMRWTLPPIYADHTMLDPGGGGLLLEQSDVTGNLAKLSVREIIRRPGVIGAAINASVYLC